MQKCTNCQYRPANVFLSQSINGKTREAAFCAECAARHKIHIHMPKMPFLGGFFFGQDMTAPMDMLNKFFEQETDAPITPQPQQNTVRISQEQIDLLTLTKEKEEALAVEDYRKAAELQKKIDAHKRV